MRGYREKAEARPTLPALPLIGDLHRLQHDLPLAGRVQKAYPVHQRSGEVPKGAIQGPETCAWAFDSSAAISDKPTSLPFSSFDLCLNLCTRTLPRPLAQRPAERPAKYSAKWPPTRERCRAQLRCW